MRGRENLEFQGCPGDVRPRRAPQKLADPVPCCCCPLQSSAWSNVVWKENSCNLVIKFLALRRVRPSPRAYLNRIRGEHRACPLALHGSESPPQLPRSRGPNPDFELGQPVVPFLHTVLEHITLRWSHLRVSTQTLHTSVHCPTKKTPILTSRRALAPSPEPTQPLRSTST